MSVPVLIICYKRSANVQRILKSLCEQGVSSVYLAIDGSKDLDSSISDLIERHSREIAKAFDIDLHIWKRDKNLGPAVSVITAIDWFFSNEESGVILEDDLVISPQLLQYFAVMLTRFESTQDVMMLSGTQFVNSRNFEQIQWTSYPVIWGWATWSDRWKSYRVQLLNLDLVKIDCQRKEKRFWKTGLRRCASGIQDAWDIPLAVSQLDSGKKTILPPVNLVSNQGADEFAGNTVTDKWPLNMEIERLPEDYSQATFNVNTPEASLDGFIRAEVYNLDKLKVLPLFLSMTLDHLRFPYWLRKPKLSDRLCDVSIPD
jgi:hypothetical protein